MVRRLIIALGLVVALCGSMATQAEAYSVYDGTPSSTYITYFRDMLTKFSVASDYVCFRSGQYDYLLVIGDLTKTDNRIQSTGSVDICEISTYSGYNATYSMSFRTEENFFVDCGDEIVYSNLGMYPTLEQRGDLFDFTTLFIVAACAVCCLFRGFFEWRNGLRS